VDGRFLNTCFSRFLIRSARLLPVEPFFWLYPLARQPLPGVLRFHFSEIASDLPLPLRESTNPPTWRAIRGNRESASALLAYGQDNVEALRNAGIAGALYQKAEMLVGTKASRF
jgi:hypothetical protein